MNRGLRLFLSCCFFSASLALGYAVLHGAAAQAATQAAPRGCYGERVAFTSQVVDANVMQFLSTRSTWSAQDFIFILPSIEWLPNSGQLIVSWAGRKGVESQVIALVNQDGRDCHIVARGFAPQPSPNGKRIAYLSRQDGTLQLYVMNGNGSAQRRLTSLAGGLQASGYNNGTPVMFAWSPDSNYIAYVSHYTQPGQTRGLSGRQQGRRQANSIHVFQSDANTSEEGAASHNLQWMFRPEGLWIIRPDGTGNKKLLSESDGTSVSSVSWLGTGRILYDALHYFASDDYHEIKSVSVSSAQPSVIVKIPGIQQDYDPIPAMAGSAILYSRDPEFRDYGMVFDLTLRSLNTGKTVALTNDFKTLTSVIPPVWNAFDHKAYFVGIHDSAYSGLFRVSKGEAPQLVSRLPEDIEAFSLSPNRRHVAWIGRDALDHLWVRVARTDGSEVHTLLDLDPIANKFKVSRPQEFSYRSKDGLKLWALLVKPLNYQHGRRYPLIVEIHGGGFSSESLLDEDGIVNAESGPLTWQYWAAKGYAVLITDYRITGTYGRKALNDTIVHQDYYERDCDDVLGAVNYVVAHGIADPARLGLVGFSYGGTHTNFMITYTHRFRAAISYEGWGDEAKHDTTLFGTCYACYRSHNGTPWNNPSAYFRESSIFHVKGVRTATMFVSGDPRFGSEPREDNEYFYAALRDQGVPTELVQYDGEGHGLSKPSDQLDLLQRATSWFSVHLKNAPLTTGAPGR